MGGLTCCGQFPISVSLAPSTLTLERGIKMSNLQRNMHRSLLKSVVQRQIFNSDGTVADVRRSVLVEVRIAGGKHAVQLMSSATYDGFPPLADTVSHLPSGSTIEVWDGRRLSRPRSDDGYRRYVAA